MALSSGSIVSRRWSWCLSSVARVMRNSSTARASTSTATRPRKHHAEDLQELHAPATEEGHELDLVQRQRAHAQVDGELHRPAEQRQQRQHLLVPLGDALLVGDLLREGEHRLEPGVHGLPHRQADRQDGVHAQHEQADVQHPLRPTGHPGGDGRRGQDQQAPRVAVHRLEERDEGLVVGLQLLPVIRRLGRRRDDSRHQSTRHGQGHSDEHTLADDQGHVAPHGTADAADDLPHDVGDHQVADHHPGRDTGHAQSGQQHGRQHERTQTTLQGGDAVEAGEGGHPSDGLDRRAQREVGHEEQHQQGHQAADEGAEVEQQRVVHAASEAAHYRAERPSPQRHAAGITPGAAPRDDAWDRTAMLPPCRQPSMSRTRPDRSS